MIFNCKKINFTFLILLTTSVLVAQENLNTSKFKQLHQELPTPNVYRTASGAPGHEYYQQKADYVINVELDEKNNILYGDETITYTNNSPDVLSYLWVQLDQNVRAKNSHSQLTATSSMKNKLSFVSIKRMHDKMIFDGGFKLEEVTDLYNKPLKYIVNETMMRIELPRALNKGQTFSFKIKYYYINDRMKIGACMDMNILMKMIILYTLLYNFSHEWRYNEVEGWQNNNF